MFVIMMTLSSCVQGDFDDIYDCDDYNEWFVGRKKTKQDVGLDPTDFFEGWRPGECATWALLYLKNLNYINSGKERNKVINALCGKSVSYVVTPETLASYDESVEAGGFGKTTIKKASNSLGINLSEKTFDDLGIQRNERNKSLGGGVIMSTGTHVIVALKYYKKNDVFEYVDIYKGKNVSQFVSANSIVWSLGR